MRTPTLEVDPEKCLGCGACAVVCPTGALDFVQPRAALRAGLRAAAESGGGVATIACARSDMPAGRGMEIRVECLGSVAATDLLLARAAGLRSLDLVDGGCVGCPTASAVAALPPAIDAAATVVIALDNEQPSAGPTRQPMTVTRLTALSKPSAAGAGLAAGARSGGRHGPKRAAEDQEPPGWAGPVLSRRQLLLFFGVRSVQVAETAAVKRRMTSVESLHAQNPPPPTHQLLVRHLDALALQGEVHVDFGTCAEPLHLAAITVSEACDSCGLCVRYYPHGALKMAEGLVVANARLCTACGLCADVCPPEAIGLRPPTLPLVGC